MAVVRLSKRLWSEYLHQTRVRASKQAAENRLRRKREALIVEHMELARTIARQVWHRFHQGERITMDAGALEDMISCAYVGLVEAAGRWEPSRGDFAKYCFFRVRGAIIDAHRRKAYIESQHASIDEWLEGPAEQNDHRDLVAQYLTDAQPLADELAEQGKRHRLMEAAIVRVLPDDERDVLRETLAGLNVAAIGADRGRSPAWARSKLLAAREKITAVLQGRAA